MDRELKVYLWITAFAALAAGAVVVFTSLNRLLLPLLLGGVTAYLLRKPVDMIGRRTGRSWAVVIVFGVQAAVWIVAAVWLLPMLIRQAVDLSRRIPEYAQNLNTTLRVAFAGVGVEALPDKIFGQTAKLPELLRGITEPFLNRISQTASALLLYAFAPVFAFFILKDSEKLARTVIYALPMRWRSAVVRTAREMDSQLWRYVTGQLVTAMIVGGMTAVGLYAAGINYAAALGAVCGVLEIVPYFGPFLSAIPVAAVASSQGWGRVLWSLAVLFIVQQTENLVLAPVIMGNSLKIHPALIILIVLTGNLLFGVPGMILAVPTAIITRVTARSLYNSVLRARQAARAPSSP